MTRYVSRSSQM